MLFIRQVTRASEPVRGFRCFLQCHCDHNWISHILGKKCLLKHVTKGKIEQRLEVMGRRERRRKQLLDDLKEKKLKEEALDYSQRRTFFG